ncbi:MAG TPA: DEAD/DEAH box helicase [Solirubrobacteraceae bacterium]|nr:DEAD/DEAH box helicase [Solirubrobacteraceae bacterium]
MSSQSFADLGVSNAVVSALSKQGITEPFQIQREVIGDVLSGRDVLARSPTGSGKTLAFGIPLVDRIQAQARRPAALVLAPTRELATQIVDELRDIAHSRALRIAAVYGGVGLLKQAEVAARSHIIVATPGRLEDQLERGAFTLDNVQMLVIDEADRMLDMGFRPAIDRIVALCPQQRQTLFFSATLDGEAGKAARRYTVDAAFHEHGPAERRASTDVEHRFVEVTHDTRLDALVDQLNAPRELALVFVRTKHGADKLVKKLDAHGIPAVAMHGNKTQRQREQALSKFESFHVDTLVATDVAARGIDVNGISHVIQFDPPHDSETYVHRSGRTGRAGATGVAISLVARDQFKDINRMVGELGIDTGLGGRPSVQAGGFSRGERPAAPARPQQGRQHARPQRAGGPGSHGKPKPKGERQHQHGAGAKTYGAGPKQHGAGPKPHGAGAKQQHAGTPKQHAGAAKQHGTGAKQHGGGSTHQHGNAAKHQHGAAPKGGARRRSAR